VESDVGVPATVAEASPLIRLTMQGTQGRSGNDQVDRRSEGRFK
jgi:hypothetical protein